MKIINSKSDISALPLAERDAFMSRLASTIYRRDETGKIVTDASAITRFGYTVADFPDAPIADYVAPIVTPPKHPAVLALEDAEKNGIEIPFGVGSVRIACGDRDRALFSSALILYRTAEDAMATEEEKTAFRASTVTFADADGTPHALTIDQARQLLVVYGATYQQIWAAAATAN